MNTDFKKVAKTIYSLAMYLIEIKGHITEISEHREALSYVTSDDFLENSSVTKVDEVRE